MMIRIFFISVFTLFFMGITVHAATVAPALIELKGERGTTIEQSFTIINTELIEKTYFLAIMKFVPKEESGSPQFIPFDEDHSGLPEWMQFPTEGVIVPSQSKLDVPFSVSIPSAVASGGYYAAILVSEAPAEIVETNGAYLEAKVAILLLLEVGGDNVSKLALLDFRTDSTDIARSTFDGAYIFRIQNQGNVHVAPTGSITFREKWSGKEFKRVLVNSENGRVLPGTTRTFTETIETQGGFFETVNTQWRLGSFGGLITTELEINDEKSGNAPVFSEITFWYFPWQLWLLIVGTGAIIFCGVLSFIKKNNFK